MSQAPDSDEATQEETPAVTMVSSPERPPGVDHYHHHHHDSSTATSDDKGRGGRKTRWDPAPVNKQAESEISTTSDLNPDNNNSTNINNNNNNNIRQANGRTTTTTSRFEDEPRGGRRYTPTGDAKRCVSYYRNETPTYPSAYYPRPPGFYDRGAGGGMIRFSSGSSSSSSRNGFDRRVDWCPRSSSRDRREYSYDRRTDREVVFDRREWIRERSVDRDRVYRSNQWHAPPGTATTITTPAASGTTEPGYPSTPVDVYEQQQQLPPLEGGVDSEPPGEEPGQIADDGYEPGEVKASRGWVYVNEHGDLQGPMELAALKLLASNGFMQEDHLVSRDGTNAWITLEHAKSPDLDSVTYMKLTKPAVPAREGKDVSVPRTPSQPKSQKELVPCFDIDGRVEKILKSYSGGDPGGDSKSVVLAALDARRRSLKVDGCSTSTLLDPWKDTGYELGFGVDADLEQLLANVPKSVRVDAPPPLPPPAEVVMPAAETASPLKWVPGKWTSRGGDWKLLHPEGHSYVKVVLNDGSLLLSQLKHYGGDPRKRIQHLDSGKRKVFELPHWAVERSQKADVNAESSARSRSTKPSKPVVKTPVAKLVENGKEMFDKASGLTSAKKVDSRVDRIKAAEKPASSGTAVEKPPVKVPKPVLRYADIMSKSSHDLARGDWFYKDGGGHEKGPYLFSELQALVFKELLTDGTSVYRKTDDVWVSVPHPELNDSNFNVTEVATSSFDGARRVRKVITPNIQQIIMGFTNGQLHEHVMKHYKNQVMSAILFEGLDARLKVIESTKKLSEVDIIANEDLSLGLGRAHQSPSSSNDTSDEREEGEQEHRYNKRLFRAFRLNGNHEQSSKKRRLIYCDDDYESSDDELPPKARKPPRLEYSDDFHSSDDELYEVAGKGAGAWEALALSTLLRICHHLKGDLKSLSSVSMTCTTWRAALHRFKSKVKCLDLSTFGVHCKDSALSAAQEYGAGNLKQLALKGCSALSAEALRRFLKNFPSIQVVDISGCDQFGDLIQSFPLVHWLSDDDSDASDIVTQGSDDSHRKMKSLKSIGTSELKDEEDVDESEPMDIDVCYSNEQDLESMTQHSETKRVKLNTSVKKENGYVKGKKNVERKIVVTKKLNKLSTLRRTGKSLGLEEDTASTLNQLVETCDMLTREWGARMTKAAMVPPVTRKYEVVNEYCIVIDKELVERKMRVEVPDDYEEKLRASKQKRGGEYSHLDIPEIKEYQPRRELGIEVLEQEVYGIDPYTHNLLLDTMPSQPAFTQSEKLQFMEEQLLQAINKEVNQFTTSGKAPIEYSLEPVIQRMIDEACDSTMQQFCQGLLDNMRVRSKEKYVAYRKGLGVVCNKEGGFKEDDFVVEFLGEVYPAWRWYEKQDGCRYLQKKDKDPAPEFYNILLERPKGDAAGYDLVVVDAMHKANFASRICHSCKPNCEAKVTAVNDRYIIGVYALRPIQNGEELTFDYNSVTESKEEYNNSICLCGSQCCRGSYLNLANAGASQEVIKECHGLLDRHALLLEACCDGPVTRLELEEMRHAGVGSCLLEGLPDWLLKYTARLVEFMNLERQRLPDELLKSVKKRRKDDYSYEMGRVDAENHAEGVFNQRLQNIAITLDKVRYVLRQLFTDPREAPPLLKKLEQKELVSRLWSADNSIVNDLLNSMKPHIPPDKLAELKRQVREHAPNETVSLRESLLWLRDTLRTLEPTVLSRHDAAADLVQMYAYTQCFFTCEEYGTFESPPLEISALDLGRHVNTSATHTWKKTYNKEYVLGQLISWFKQSAADPGASLMQARRGCLVLPDFSSCYAKGLQQDSRRAYGSRFREEMFPRMERWPQKQWPKSQFWEFKSNRGLFGSPMLDAVQRGGHPDVEMMHWLKTRPVNFVGPYDD